jgi:hypothetical protein
VNGRIETLRVRLHALEAELQDEMAQARQEIGCYLDEHGLHMPAGLRSEQQRLKTGLWRYLRSASWPVMLTAPLIYAGLPVFLLMDLFVCVYQRLCFPVYGIARARRADFVVFDRAQLPYLNAIEKLNCAYCSYANGVAAFAREVASRTEQHWCPIKHARRMQAAHERYAGFFEFGDAAGYRERLQALRQEGGPPPPGGA